MPFTGYVCVECDMLVPAGVIEHGPEDEYCECAERERIDLWTDGEVRDGRAARAVALRDHWPSAAQTNENEVPK